MSNDASLDASYIECNPDVAGQSNVQLALQALASGGSGGGLPFLSLDEDPATPTCVRTQGHSAPSSGTRYLVADFGTFTIWTRTNVAADWAVSAATVFSDSVDPTADPGVAHSTGDYFVQFDPDTSQPLAVWLGGSGGDTDWSDVTSTVCWRGNNGDDPVSPSQATGFGTAAQWTLALSPISGYFVNFGNLEIPQWGSLPTFVSQGFLAIYFPPDGMLADGIPSELDLEVDAGLGIRRTNLPQGFGKFGSESVLLAEGERLSRVIGTFLNASVTSMVGTDDPTDGDGVVHSTAAIYYQDDGSGALVVWRSTGPDPTDWVTP